MEPDEPQESPVFPSAIYYAARDRISKLTRGATYKDVYGCERLKGRLERIDRAVIKYACDEKYNTEAASPDDDYELLEIIELKRRLVLAECDKEVREMLIEQLREILVIINKYRAWNGLENVEVNPCGKQGYVPGRVQELIALFDGDYKPWESNTDHESQRTLQAEPSL